MITIVHPTDFSKNAELAFRYCLAWTKKFEVHIHVLHITESPTILTGDSSSPTLMIMEEKKINEILERLNVYCNNAMPYFTNQFSITKQVRVNPSTIKGILSFSDMIGADLIALGTRGENQAKELFVGSTTKNIILKSTCPVLSVPISTVTKEFK